MLVPLGAIRALDTTILNEPGDAITGKLADGLGARLAALDLDLNAVLQGEPWSVPSMLKIFPALFRQRGWPPDAADIDLFRVLSHTVRI